MTYIWWWCWCWYIENVYYILYILSRLEALPSMDRKANQKKKSVPMLNTMGTFWGLDLGMLNPIHTQHHAQYHGHFLNMVVDRKANEKKKNLLMLSTMGTFWRLDLHMEVETMILHSGWAIQYLTSGSVTKKIVKRYISENINGLWHATTVISSSSKRTKKSVLLFLRLFL